MSVTTLNLVTGWPANRPIQCWAFGGVTPAVFNSDDILSANVYPARSTTSMFSPTVHFYTADSTQSGFAQGQVEPEFTGTQMALMMPGIHYTLAIFRVLAANPSMTPDPIARVLINVEPIAIN
jgi:hypothetical protein